MKGIYVSADINNKGGEFHTNAYFPFHHPHIGWINILKLDTLNIGFNPNPPINWNEYELAVVLSHGSCIGAATKVRKLNPKIKLIVIAEPPPAWLLNRTPFPEFPLMVDDLDNANIILQENEGYIDEWKGRFSKNSKKIFWVPTPLNIVEYRKFFDISKREKIVASTSHCNFWESPKRSWEIINKSLPIIKRLGFRTRWFYEETLEGLRQNLKITPDEVCPFLWDDRVHSARLNQVYAFVDDNICLASGHICLEVAALEIPSVGSNDYILHLFPELCARPEALDPQHFREKSGVGLLSEKLNHLLEDKSYYDSMVKIGLENLNKYYSYEASEKRIKEILEQ